MHASIFKQKPEPKPAPSVASTMEVEVEVIDARPPARRIPVTKYGDPPWPGGYPTSKVVMEEVRPAGKEFFYNNTSYAPGDRVRVNLAFAAMALEHGVCKLVEGSPFTAKDLIAKAKMDRGEG